MAVFEHGPDLDRELAWGIRCTCTGQDGLLFALNFAIA